MIRGRLQTLIEHDVSADFIFEVVNSGLYLIKQWSSMYWLRIGYDVQNLLKELMKLLSESLQNQVTRLYQNYNVRKQTSFDMHRISTRWNVDCLVRAAISNFFSWGARRGVMRHDTRATHGGISPVIRTRKTERGSTTRWEEIARTLRGLKVIWTVISCSLPWFS